MSDRYANERFNPTISHCGRISLTFDGKKLTVHGGKHNHQYDAVSGVRINGTFSYSVEAQKARNRGPIPAGVYWIRPDEMWENAWYKLASQEAWGNHRITIHPFKTTETYDRGGFFIHGGAVPGSIGCIDLSNQMEQFVKDLKEEVGPMATCQIHLEVNY